MIVAIGSRAATSSGSFSLIVVARQVHGTKTSQKNTAVAVYDDETMASSAQNKYWPSVAVVFKIVTAKWEITFHMLVANPVKCHARNNNSQNHTTALSENFMTPQPQQNHNYFNFIVGALLCHPQSFGSVEAYLGSASLPS